MSFLRFFVYSNFFIACCAILMACQTYQLLHVLPDPYFIGFLFSSTICSYSFHWYLDPGPVIESPRLKWRQQHRPLHLVLFLTGLTGAIVFFFFLIDHWFWLVSSAFITFLYTAPKIRHPWFRALRKVAIGKTIFLAFVWMYVTTALPIQVSGQDWSADLYLFAVGRFFFVYAICILFDYRDRIDDKMKGIRSLITWMDERGVRNLFAASLVIYLAATVGLLYYDYSALIIAGLLAPGLIVAVLFDHARKNFSDIFYYFVLDGLMALPALLTLMTGI